MKLLFCCLFSVLRLNLMFSLLSTCDLFLLVTEYQYDTDSDSVNICIKILQKIQIRMDNSCSFLCISITCMTAKNLRPNACSFFASRENISIKAKSS